MKEGDARRFTQMGPCASKVVRHALDRQTRPAEIKQQTEPPQRLQERTHFCSQNGPSECAWLSEREGVVSWLGGVLGPVTDRLSFKRPSLCSTKGPSLLTDKSIGHLIYVRIGNIY